MASYRGKWSVLVNLMDQEGFMTSHFAIITRTIAQEILKALLDKFDVDISWG